MRGTAGIDAIAARCRDHGYAHIEGLFGDAEVRALQEECERIVALEEAAAEAVRESFPRLGPEGCPARNLIDPVVPRSALFRRLFEEPKVLDVLRGVLRDEPRLFKDKLILRPPGTDGYGLHQDYAYWGWTGATPSQLLALQVAVDDADAENGAVCFHPDGHRSMLDPTAGSASDLRRDAVGTLGELIETRAGDGIVFHSLTPHWSEANRSSRYRRTLYLTYNASAAGDLYRIYYQDRADAVRQANVPALRWRSPPK